MFTFEEEQSLYRPIQRQSLNALKISNSDILKHTLTKY